MAEKYNVLILIERIYRANGGASTSLDLAEAVNRLGHNGQLGIATGSALKLRFESRLRLIKDTGTVVPVENIYSMPDSWPIRSSMEKNADNTSYLNPGIWKTRIVGFIENREEAFQQVLSEADLVIDACMLPADTFSEIKKYTSAPVIYNHNGSPDAVDNYWISDYHLSEEEFSSSGKYSIFCSRYDGILFQAHDQAAECANRGAMSAKNCFVVPPSCLEREVLAARLLDSPYDNERKALVLVGSVQHRKGQDLAIEAFKYISDDFPALDLHIVGGGSGLESDYGNSLKKMAAESGIRDRVFFHGHREDYLRFMAHADILIQSSRAEGVSRILREAMLMKLPIVSFNIPGTSSTLQSGKEALLAEPLNTKELSEAIKRLLLNRELTLTIAEAAFQKYLLNHSQPAYASNISSLISHLCE
ncbi:glycosyltransferase family 4 protein [Rhodohalobacter sp. 8-1]|uniref:glycosyltransferase family 4 protein n=1 Tax=Rhodohalobacter sp. 8-1 TaxID=3131972 RepID=UPI0030EC634A